jgi:hypothetical protein
MNITLDALKKLINEELQRKDIPDIDDEEKVSVAQALDVLENASYCSEDPDETKWYLTKIGETFGLEPEEE